ncbi:MAG: response regulator [Proteobacteria bacterium]|nr:response regulator [Pseudomonadota bacterium]
MKTFRKYAWVTIFITLVAIYSIADYVLKNQVIIKSFMDLEDTEARKNLSRCMDAFKGEIHHLHGLASDWAIWDDTFQFAKDGNEKYIESNLQMDTLEANGNINLIYIVTPGGKTVWGKAFYSEHQGFIDVIDTSSKSLDMIAELQDFGIPGHDIKGILLTNYGPMLIASIPILDSLGSGPSTGDFIMGRFISRKMIDALVDQTKVDFTIKTVNDDDLTDQEKEILIQGEKSLIVVRDENETRLLTYGVLPDIYGKPALLIRATLPRTIMEKGKTAARYVSISLMITLILGTVLLLFLIKAYIFDERRRTASVEALVEQRTLELQRANDEIERARIMAVEASKAKSEFLANMSHEIRTPLNGIIGMAEIAMTTIQNDKQREIFETINREGHALLGIITNILDFSKIEARKVDIETINFDLRLLVNDIGKSIAFLAEQKGLFCDVFLSPDVPHYVCGDPGRIRQILMNLSGNALKFTENGGLTLNCELSEDLGEICVIRCSVTDTGIGIEKNKQETIFESFTQADNSTTRKFGGTGLGISISKQLVELMGGQLGLESRINHGSTFWFTLSVKRQKEQVLAPINEPFGGLSILVVGGMVDEPVPYLDQIKALGIHAETVACGKDALNMLKDPNVASHIDMVIIDYLLPDTDGFILAQDIKALASSNKIPIILTTRTGNIGDGRKCEDIGISGYLNSPFDSFVLRHAISLVYRKNKSQNVSAPMGLVTRHTISESFKQENRILLVEDYPTNRYVALNFLCMSGFDVDIAENGKEAVEAFQKCDYDLILMDIQMPVMGGLEATRIIRKLETDRGKQKTPIIAMTANAMKQDRESCLNSGMDDYITKPITRDSLTKIISSWIVLPTPPKNVTYKEPLVFKAADSTHKDEPPLDFNRALEEFMGEKTILLATLDYFLGHGRTQMETINQALIDNMTTLIAEEAHKLKGGAANVTMDVLAQAAADLEITGKSGQIDQAKDFISKINHEFDRLEFFLSQITSDES